MHQQNEGWQISTKTTYLPAISSSLSASTRRYSAFLSQLAYNPDILSKFVSKKQKFMILTDSMLDAAFRFRETEAWKTLDDSNVFAVRLSDGQTVYCSIMGNGGEHHSLGIYIGDNGFSTYLRIFMDNDGSFMSNMHLATLFDCINCDYMQAKDIEEDVKKAIRKYADSHGVKIPRKHGWIDFTRHTPYRGQWCITDKNDAMIAEEALRAATFLANELAKKGYEEVGFDASHDYPTVKGGKKIPLIVQDGDSYTIQSTLTPALVETEYVAPVFNNDILAHNLASIEKTEPIVCRLEHLHTPVMSEDNEQPHLPGMLVLVTESDGEMLLPLASIDYPENTQALLTELANHFCRLKIHPEEIKVSDNLTFALISDFCKKCDIKLTKADSLPDLDDICTYMVNDMMFGNF